ncbi:MAG: ROK family protein [Actinobacteria bacterium]|nr:ROK family protein [Actinomycetota bacterium]
MTRAYLAVDIGGTKLLSGVVTLDGHVVVQDRCETPTSNVWDAIAQLVNRVRAAAGEHELVACGVGCGGPMSDEGDKVSNLHIKEWSDFPLRSSLSKLTGLPTFVDNDAKAVVLGETWCGAAVGHRDVIGMVVSTGVGGGIVSDGRLVTGRSGNGGHIGHVIVEPDGRRCACGARGCLEAHASGPSIEAITGVPATHATLQTKQLVGRQVGRALASVGALMDLDYAVIGGSVALGFGEPFFRAVQDELDASAQIEFIRGFRVSPVGLGAFAPLVGAAAVARSATSV